MGMEFLEKGTTTHKSVHENHVMKITLILTTYENHGIKTLSWKPYDNIWQSSEDW